MYFYFYDASTQEKRHLNTLRQIETSLIDLGISGRIEKVSPFSEIGDQLANAIKNGVTTVVIVGSDETFVQAVNIIARYQDVALAFIPLSSSSIFGAILGMPQGAKSCDIIAKRLYQRVDLGVINDTYFFGSVEIPTGPSLQLRCDDTYSIVRTNETDIITIQNVGDLLGAGTEKLYPAHLSSLHLVVESVSKKRFFRKNQPELIATQLQVKKVEITAPNDRIVARVDHTIDVALPCLVSVASQQLRLIIGRDRLLEEPLYQ